MEMVNPPEIFDAKGSLRSKMHLMSTIKGCIFMGRIHVEFFYQRTLIVVPKHVEMHLNLKNQAGKKMATYNLNCFVWDLKIWILETYPNCIQWWTKQPDIIPRALTWSNFRKFDKTEYQLLFGPDSVPILMLTPTDKELKETWLIGSLSYIRGEDVPFIQSVKPVENVDQVVAINDHIPTCPTDSNTLLEDVDSLFKEVIDVRPNFVGRVGELRTKIVQTLASTVSNKETIVGNLMSPNVSCLKPDKLDEQMFDDALQDNAEANLDETLKNKKVNLDQCIADVMDAENNTVGLDTPLLKQGFGLVERKRKPGPALQSPYEQQQPTTPCLEKRRTITSQLLQLQLNDDSNVADEELESIDSKEYTIEEILPFCEDLRRHKKNNLYKVIVNFYIKALMKKVKDDHSTSLFKLVWDPYGIIVDLEF
nr:phospholipase-like protein [Tanacetum cinerariifolium]